jgi:hypothetical protein
VVCAWSEIQKEWFVWSNLLAVGHELDGLVGKVFSQVIALLRSFGWIDLVIVVNQIGIILMGVST